MTQELHPLTQAVITGKRKEVPTLVQALLDAGEQPKDIVESKLIPGMMVVGDKFKRNEIFVPEMLVAARAMKEALKILEPMLAAAGIKPLHTAIIGTVEGDLHDIGKNLVAMMWKGAGFEVIDLGVNVPPAKFLQAAQESKADIIGLSTLLTTTLPAMKTTVTELRQAKISAKLMVGGAPVTDALAKEIGADGYAPDASCAVDVALALLKNNGAKA